MNIFAFVSLMNAIIVIVLGDLIFDEDRNSKHNRTFAIFCGFMALWAFTEFMFRQTGEVQIASLWTVINKLSWRFTVAALLGFIFAFSGVKKETYRFVIFFAYASALLFSVIDITTDTISTEPMRFYWGFTYLPREGFASVASRLWAVVIAVTSLIISFFNYIAAPAGKQKKQARIIAFALTIPIVAGLFELSVQGFGIAMPEPTTASFTWLAIFIGYAIWRYKLFVVSPAVAAENIIADMTDGLYLSDKEAKLLTINQAGRSLLKGDENYLLGESMEKIFYEPSAWRTIHKRLIAGKQLKYFETKLSTRHANPVEVLVSASPVKAGNGDIRGYVVIAKNVSELKKSKYFHYLAHHDPLTGLPNRMLLKDRLNQSLAFAERAGLSLAVLYMDIDNFKKINDNLGHHVGDYVLREISQRIKPVMRRGDTLAREGGDEFTYIAVNLKDVNNIKTIVKRIISEAKKPFIIEGREILTSVTIGISVFPFDGSDANELINVADIALLRAKKTGKGIYKFYNDRFAAA